MTLLAIQSLVTDLVRDRDEVVSDAQRDAAIAAAVLQYSADRPRVIVVDVTFAGTSRAAVPVEWIEGFSKVLQFELPIGQSPASLLAVDSIAIYRSPTDVLLELPCGATFTGDVRVTHTTAHVLDGATDTIPTEHSRSVAAWAAADLCDQLASHYATEGTPSIGADVTDYRAKTEKFASRASAYRKQYRDTVGVSDRRLEPASAIATLQRRDSLGGQPMFHRVRR